MSKKSEAIADAVYERWIASKPGKEVTFKAAIIVAVEAGMKAHRATAGRMGMTVQQKNLLAYIEAYAADHDGVAPSFDEMKDALGLRSKSGVHRLILALEERGKIARLPNRARCIELLRAA